MIQLLYFARLREALNLDGEDYALDEPIAIADLMHALAARGGVWADEFGGKKNIRAAVNQEVANGDQLVYPGNEVAFFPPVTGG